VDVREFIEKTKLPGKIIFGKLWGSRSHNTELPTSDEDFLAVYVSSNKELLGMFPPPDTVDNPTDVKPDYQAHEVGKFCQLLLKGNPSIVEMLFTDRMCFDTPDWLTLKAYRKKFLSQVAVRQYLGYAEGQLKKLAHHTGNAGLHTKGGKYSEKWAYHMVRLLWDAKRIAQGGEPVVWKEGLERDHLMQIRMDLLTQEAVERLAKSEIAAIDAMRPWKIPEEADKRLLNDWLLCVRGLEA